MSLDADNRSRLASLLVESGICSADDLAKVSSETSPDAMIDGLVVHGHLSQDQSVVLKQLALGPLLDAEAHAPSGNPVERPGSTGVGDFRTLWAVPALTSPSERYTERTQHAKGGMGRVIRAYDTAMRREVAIKELLPEVYHLAGGEMSTLPQGVGANQEAIERFLNEARITGQLEHPAIVPVYEIGTQADGSPYYTMKLVRGQSLAEAIRSRKSLPERLKLLPHFIDLCQAIAFAHSHGVIHRDIKPSNVLLGEYGETVVIDWGLAKMRVPAPGEAPASDHPITVTDSGRTVMGQVMGTPIYMAPEQARGALDEIDERSDVYSLGVVLYEILVGEAPFLESKPDALLALKQRESPPPVQHREKHAPPELAAICEHAIRRDPADRYQSAGELAKEVERFLSGSLVEAYQYSYGQQIFRFARRYKLPLTVAAVAVWILAVMGVAQHLQVLDERDAALTAGVREAAARTEAEAALEAAELASANARASEVQMQRELYFSTVGLAHTHMLAGEYTRARQLLAEAPADLRGWEWHWLQFQLNEDWWAWPSPPVYPRQVDFTPVVDWSTKRVVTNSQAGRARWSQLVDIGNRAVLQGGRTNDEPSQGAWILPDDGGILRFERGLAVRLSVDGFDANVLRRHPIHSAMDWTPTLSSDRKRGLIGSSMRSVAVFNLSELRPVQDFACDEAVANALMNPSASRVVTAHTNQLHDTSAPAVVTIWDAGSGEPIVQRHGFRAHPIAIASTEPLCAVTREDGGAVLVDLDSGEERRALAGLEGVPARLVFAGNAARLATVDNAGRATLHDTATGDRLDAWELNCQPSALALSPDGETIAAGTEVGGLHILTAGHQRALRGHTGRVRSIQFCPEGILLAVVDEHDLRIWNLAAPGPTVTIAEPLRTAQLVGHPLMLHGVTASGESGVWCPSTGEPKPHGSPLTLDSPSSLLSPQGAFILARQSDGVRIVYADDGETVFAIEGSDFRHAPAAFAPDDSRLALISHEAGGEPAQLIVIDLAGGGAGRRFPLRTIEDGEDAYHAALAFLSDGSRVVVAHGEGITEYDAVTGVITRATRLDPVHAGYGNAAAISPQRHLFAASGVGGSIVTMTGSGGRGMIGGHAAQVTAIAFDPTGARMVTGAVDGTLKVWDVTSGRELIPLPTLEGAVREIRFDDTTGMMLAVPDEGAARVFHVMAWGVDLDSHLPGLELNEQLALYRMVHPQVATTRARCQLAAQEAALTGLGYGREEALGVITALYPDAPIVHDGCHGGEAPCHRLFLHTLLGLIEDETEDARREALMELLVANLHTSFDNPGWVSEQLKQLAHEALECTPPRAVAALATAHRAKAEWPLSNGLPEEFHAAVSQAEAANGNWAAARDALAPIIAGAQPEQKLLWARIHANLGSDADLEAACDALETYLGVRDISPRAIAVHADLAALGRNELDERLDRIAQILVPDPAAARALPWRTDLAEALDEAAENERVVLVCVESTSAIESMLESQPQLGRPDIAEAITAHTIPVLLDAADAPAAWRLTRLPALVALNRNGEPIWRVSPDFSPIYILHYLDGHQGRPGAIRALDFAGPIPFDGAVSDLAALVDAVTYPAPMEWDGSEFPWSTALINTIDNRFTLPGTFNGAGRQAFVAVADITAPTEMPVQVFARTAAEISLMVNGELVDIQQEWREDAFEPARIGEATLRAGANRLMAVIVFDGELAWLQAAVQCPAGGEAEGLVWAPVLNERFVDTNPDVARLESTERTAESTIIELNKDEVLTEWRDTNVEFVREVRFDLLELETGSLGVKFHNASEIALTRRLGFRDGDILVSVNGITIDDPGGLVDMFDEFDGKIIPEWDVKILRGGREMTITYLVEY